MGILPQASSFRGLLVYQKSRALAQEIFLISQSFPKEESYALTDQIRRSSRSIGAQITAAWGKRRYEKHFISKLTDADGEQQETQHWLEIAIDCQYITSQQHRRLVTNCTEIGRLLGGMTAKSHKFCQSHAILKEIPAQYLTNTADC